MEYSWLVVAVLLVVVLFWSREKPKSHHVQKIKREPSGYVNAYFVGKHWAMPRYTYSTIFSELIARPTGNENIIEISHWSSGQTVSLNMPMQQFIERVQDEDATLLTQLGEAGIDYSLIFRAIKHSQL